MFKTTEISTLYHTEPKNGPFSQNSLLYLLRYQIGLSSWPGM
jgi:hypothetical protein